jgi:hypothetical protein
MVVASPFEIEIGDEVIRNDLCEVVEVVGMRIDKGREPRYKVFGTSVITGDLTGWFTFSELTI